MKVTKCDRCQKEYEQERDEFQDAFDSFVDKSWSESGQEFPYIYRRLDLCPKCLKGYKKILREANTIIKKYLNP